MIRQAVIGLVFCAVVVRSQPAPAPPFAAIEGTFLAVSVQDLDASIRWYTEKFDLTLNSRLASGDVSVALLSGHGLDVELLYHRDSVARPFPFDLDAAVRTRGLVKVGFRVADFDRAVAALRSRGVEIVLGPFPPRADQRANVLIRDGDQNLLQLFGDFAH
jgi:catechol 2,3-dioxygenase-like lactoylglutathione lyase family enzyme